jgi:hypothetical protein
MLGLGKLWISSDLGTCILFSMWILLFSFKRENAFGVAAEELDCSLDICMLKCIMNAMILQFLSLFDLFIYAVM